MKLLPVLALILIPGLAWSAITFTGSGSFTDTVDANDLTVANAAGNNLNSSYESSTTAASVSITNCQNKNDTWRVDVRRSDISWSTGLQVYIQRTTDGTPVGPAGTITGGTPYGAAIGTTDATFFSGSGDRTNIYLQIKAASGTGLFYALAVALYQTNIIISLVDT